MFVIEDYYNLTIEKIEKQIIILYDPVQLFSN
jgi:hypothetical protein